MLHLQFGPGDHTEWDAKVEAALHAAFDGLSGLLVVELYYTAGQGYRIIRAAFSPPGEVAAGVGAKTRPPSQPEDYTAQVRQVLAGIGAPAA